MRFPCVYWIFIVKITNPHSKCVGTHGNCKGSDGHIKQVSLVINKLAIKTEDGFFRMLVLVALGFVRKNERKRRASFGHLHNSGQKITRNIFLSSIVIRFPQTLAFITMRLFFLPKIQKKKKGLQIHKGF